MKSVLVTGGAGFIGSHLCEFLLNKQLKVIVMDNLISGDEKNIDHLKINKNFSFINHDVSKYIDFQGSLNYVLHFASPASPIDYQKAPIQTLKAGSLGTHNTLGLAKEKKSIYLLASTSEVYGDPLINPQSETYWGNVNCVGIRGCYDEAKRFSEAMAMAYKRVHNVDVRILRIFNTYGPKMRKNDGRVFPNFINQALKGEPITVYGEGKQTRSFCFVSDLIEGIYKLMMTAVNGPINFGNPEEHTILELAEIIKSQSNSKSDVVFSDLPADDPHVRCPDITKAKKLLKWEPKVSLQDGISKTMEYFS
jgi:dTDP-glucose 4,6-dehydratase